MSHTNGQRQAVGEAEALLGYYHDNGCKLVRLSRKTKKNVDTEWQLKDVPLSEIVAWWRQGGNIGKQLGKVSDWRAAADCDCSEAVALAPRFLPDTLRLGKGSGVPDVYLYRSPGLGFAKFKDLDGETLIDLKASNDGAGHQIVVPPSIHPEKGPYWWERGYNPAAIAEVHAAELRATVGALAVATLITRHLPDRGRHDLAMALAGYMLRNGLNEDEVLEILTAAWVAKNVPREHLRDLHGIVPDTAAKLRRGERATGGRTLEELVPGMSARIAKFLGWEHADNRDGTPKIQVNGRHLRDVSADTLKALQLANDPPEIFVRSGALVRVREDEHGTPQIQNMDLNHLRGRADRCADFVRATKRGDRWIETKVNPPEIVMKDLMALPSWPFPALEAVVESPILRPDGTIFDTPGYDAQTRLYYRPAGGFQFPSIQEEPSKADVRGALELINEAIGEFPYADKASAANTLGLMLTPLVRQAINGPVPLALIDKPQAGTGGSLLAETISVIGSGRTAEMLGAPKDDEEWRKQITAKLSAGGTMVTVDNVEGALYAPSLARALTARTWTDRILGRSETVTVSQRATWVATGNNIILRGDLPRRCYWIRLDAKDSRPWQRANFKHSDLLSWVSGNRGRLVHALLTIARAWFAAGKPKADNLPRLGSFETWTEIVGGMVTFAGIPGFLDNLSDLYDKADEGGAEWEAFLEEWWRQRGEDPITVKDLTALIEDEKQLRESLPGDLLEAWDKSRGSFTRRLGNALSKRAGTRYGEEGLHVKAAGEFRRAKLWSVLEGSDECEFVSFVSLYNPSASKNMGNIPDNNPKVAGSGPEINSTNSQTHPNEIIENEEELFAEMRRSFHGGEAH